MIRAPPPFFHRGPSPLARLTLFTLAAAAAMIADHRFHALPTVRLSLAVLAHPVQHRCSESACKFWKLADGLGREKWADPDLDQFIFEFQITGAKLAGSLGAVARDQCPPDPGFTVACLKRALNHLGKSLAALEAVAPRKLLPETMVAEARQELLEIREEILRLMDTFRGRGSR